MKKIEHTNGIIYRYYQVHDILSKTMEAYGARSIKPDKDIDYTDFIDNAVTKILKNGSSLKKGSRCRRRKQSILFT